jgi:hypothetical protein
MSMRFREFFRRRRDRECAFLATDVEALERRGAPAPGPAASGSDKAAPAAAAASDGGHAADSGEELELPGGSPAELGSMIARAISSGNAQISTESHVLDMRGSGLREEILGLLSGQGVDLSQGGQVNLDGSEGTGQELVELLRRHGLDLGPASGSAGSDADEPRSA